MSSLHDMISAFIAMLLSAAFLHFGASGDAPHQSRPVPVASREAASASSAASVHALPGDSDGSQAARSHATHASHSASRSPVTHRACPRQSGGLPTLDALRTASPVRRG